MKNYFIAIIAFCSILAWTSCSENNSVTESKDDESELSSSSSSDIEKDFNDEFDDENDNEFDPSSSSSRKSEKENAKSSSSSARKSVAEEYTDSLVLGTKIRSEFGDVSILQNKYKDSKTGDIYKTIQFGPYIWMAENVRNPKYGLCYDEDSQNCEKYGRLYRADEAEDACPAGLKIPTIEDYKEMARWTEDIGSSEFGFNFQKGGSGVLEDGELTFSGLGSSDALLAKDGAYMRVKDGNKVFFGSTEDDNYYSLRCLKYTLFVETEEMLPPCNSQLKGVTNFYVADKRVNYHCNGEIWRATNEDKCNHDKGTRFYSKDTLFVCKDTWKIATMNDLDVRCYSSNVWQEQKLNGKLYVCDESVLAWREETALEKALGVCTYNMVGKVDTLINQGIAIDYACDSAGWHRATKEDYIGKCNSNNHFDEAWFKGVTYICRIHNSWETYQGLEESLGFCSPKYTGTIDTIVEKKDTILYYCDSTYWRKAELTDVFGKCNASKFWSVVKFKNVSYSCRTNGKWTQLSSAELDIGICTPSRKDEIDTTSYGPDFYCSSNGWRTTTVEDYYGPCDSSKFYTTLLFSGRYYGCTQAPEWTLLEYPERDLGYCTPAMHDSIKVDHNSVEYICDTEWRKATQEEVLGKCSEAIEGSTKMFNKTKFACVGDKWIEPSAIDDSLGICTKARLKETGTYKNKGYVCSANGWVEISIIAAKDTCNAERENDMVEYQNESYVCHDDVWEKATGIEAAHGVCTASREEEIVKFESANHVCRNGAWVRITSVAVLHGACTDEREEEVIYYEKTYYMCYSKMWHNVKEIEARLGRCTFIRDGEIVKEDEKTYLCTDDQWVSVTGFLAEYGKCKADREGFSVRYDGVLYKCESNRWVLPEA